MSLGVLNLELGLSAQRGGGGGGAAQTFTTDFGEYDTGAAPSDWTLYGTTSANIIAEGGTVSGKVLQINSSGGTERDTITWNDVPAAADVDICAVLKSNISTNIGTTGAAGRVLGIFDLYAGGLRGGASVADRGNVVHRRLGGVYSIVATALNIDWASDTYYVVRYQIDGTTHRVKRWPLGSQEPGSWSIETTDTGVTDAGAVGIHSTPIDTNERVTVQYFSVGIDGAAPVIPA